MIGSIFKRDIRQATGTAWEEWVARLRQTVDPSWSHEEIKTHICHQYGVTDEWGEWLAAFYGQLLGRKPVGVTKDAGVQIGVRKTVAMTKEEVWSILVSPQGVKLWIGDVPSFQLQKGFEFESAEGVSGKLTVVDPGRKLRMTWKRKEWEQPSRLQIYVLPANSGKTTIAIHQEMLKDIYMREMMRRYWEKVLQEITRPRS